ncbi:hypothetical protein BaRGS_00030570 [Batillaria attramentaria]|uniref:Uncharacterized protein n=1 Tax=Batillaria attramentaria TaxID=370345 RepID=A0ABD0JU50_9CAEN
MQVEDDRRRSDKILLATIATATNCHCHGEIIIHVHRMPSLSYLTVQSLFSRVSIKLSLPSQNFRRHLGEVIVTSSGSLRAKESSATAGAPAFS